MTAPVLDQATLTSAQRAELRTFRQAAIDYAVGRARNADQYDRELLHRCATVAVDAMICQLFGLYPDGSKR